MKKIYEMSYEELSAYRREQNNSLGELYVKAANRELMEDEKMQERTICRELNEIDERMKSINRDMEHTNAMSEQRTVAVAARFREVLSNARKNPEKSEREILLAPGNNSDGTANVTGNITASGAIALTINEIIPTLHEGLQLPDGLRLVTGVVGNEIWPVSINDVEVEEVGEVEALSDQVLEFQNISPTVRRCGLTVPVSNMAIDNAAFDLLGFVQQKFAIALREYWAKKVYSHAEWTGNAGAFSAMAPKGVIVLNDGNAYKNILKAVAEFSDKGFFEGEVCLSMDRKTEAELMATPKIAGAAGGFIIENGRCAGFRYTVSHYVNTELNAAGKLVPTAARYILIGYYEWMAAQQHGSVRLTIDPISQAKKNVTAVTLNTAFSLTDLSKYINGAQGTTQAFGCYLVADDNTPLVSLNVHAAKVGLGQTKALTAVTLPADASVTWTSSDTAVATVANGVVTPVASGTATITAKITVSNKNYTDTCTVTVA
jgi:hypothetical protein